MRRNKLVSCITVVFFIFLTLILTTKTMAFSLNLVMESEPGDYIGQGLTYSYDESDIDTISPQTFDSSSDGLVDFVRLGLRFNPFPGGDWWNLDFNTDELPGVNLEPGFYDDAQRASFADPGHPGLDVSGNGRGSNTLTGSFTILEATFDYSGTEPEIISFAATFEQHSGGAEPALFGALSYNNPVPIPATILLLGSGLIGLAGARRKLRK